MSNINSTIKKILLSFEQSRTSIDYGKIYTWNDGPNKIKQITLSFGITEYGNLKKFIQQYCAAGGQYKEKFETYIPKISTTSLVQDNNFITLLKESSKDPVMQRCQETAFDEMYIIPSLKWAEKNEFKLNLSKLVIADSFLQSGSILGFLRNKFSEKIPANGGDEKKWIESYCNVRREWLKTHSNKILNNTIYRVNFMLDCIKKEDWGLSEKLYTPNGVKVIV